jgi:hypothetical protein
MHGSAVTWSQDGKRPLKSDIPDPWGKGQTQPNGCSIERRAVYMLYNYAISCLQEVSSHIICQQKDSPASYLIGVPKNIFNHLYARRKPTDNVRVVVLAVPMPANAEERFHMRPRNLQAAMDKRLCRR